VSTRYWNDVAARYDGYYRDVYSALENATVERLLRRHLARCGNVLDVGCGTGLGRDLLPAELEYTGCDPAAHMLRLARLKHPFTPFFEGSAERLPFADQTFDGALALFMVWSLVDPPAAAHELAGVLLPGSPVLLMALNRRSLWRLRQPTHEDVYATRGDHQRGALARFYAPAEFSAALRPHFCGRVLSMSWLGNTFQRHALWPLDRALCVLLPHFAHNLIFVGWRDA